MIFELAPIVIGILDWADQSPLVLLLPQTFSKTVVLFLRSVPGICDEVVFWRELAAKIKAFSLSPYNAGLHIVVYCCPL